jgi:hypothetical protein
MSYKVTATNKSVMLRNMFYKVHKIIILFCRGVGV